MRKPGFAAAALFILGLFGRNLCAASCDASGLLLNGFEGASSTCPNANDIALWTGFTPAASTLVSNSVGFAVPEGDTFGRNSWASASFVSMTLTAANFGAVGSDWSSHSNLHVAYATSSTAANQYVTAFQISTTANSAVLFRAGTNVTGTAYPSATNWTYAVLSLNYVKNLGLDLSSVVQLQLQQSKLSPASSNINYDHLAFNDTSNTANSAVPPAQISTSSGCAGFSISWTAQSQSGTDPIYGYHIYRSTFASTGPFLSYSYTTATSYLDISPASTTQYYVILPFSSSTTAFGGGATGYFMYCASSSVDPGSAPTGVNEKLIVPAADAAGPFNPYAGCSPTYSPTYSATYTGTPPITPPPPITPTPTYTDTPTITETYTPTPTASPTATPFSGSPTDSPTPGPSATESPIVPTGTISPTFSHSPTITPVVTPTPYIASALIYPNPFNPDKGEVFHLGNVPAGETMTIYNMIGELVYSMKVRGSLALDVWDGLNNNGVKVVTGVYFLVITNSTQVYRVAVVREGR